jgi:hypothetical protein
MAGHLPSSMSYAITRALPLLSSSPKLPESLVDSLYRIGEVVISVSREMRQPSYFQSTENRFTGSFILSTVSILVPVGALALEDKHYK